MPYSQHCSDVNNCKRQITTHKTLGYMNNHPINVMTQKILS